MSFLSKWFKKPVLTDDDPGVEPLRKNIKDEIQLCTNCPFSGKCEWPSGCTSFKQILNDRAKAVAKIRGCKFEAERSPTVKRGFGWIVGMGWRVQMDRNQYKVVRIVKVIDATQEAVVIAFDNGHVSNKKDEYVVKIPTEETVDGFIIVNMQKLRQTIRASLNEWHV